MSTVFPLTLNIFPELTMPVPPLPAAVPAYLSAIFVFPLLTGFIIVVHKLSRKQMVSRITCILAMTTLIPMVALSAIQRSKHRAS